VPAGGLFPIGATTVTYTATDASGNSVSSTQKVTVTRVPTTTRVTVGAATYGDASVLLTANVSAQAPSIAVVSAGTVTFTLRNGAVVLATSGPRPVSAGVASASVALPAGLRVGSYTVAASYSGSAMFEPSVGSGTLPTNCPHTLTIPFAIPLEDGQVIRGTLQGVEQTVNSQCVVSFTLAAAGFTLGTGTFVADHTAPGVIAISDGTISVRGVRLPLRFAGSIDLNAMTMRITFTYPPRAMSRTVTVRLSRLASGELGITSVVVTSP
jgi:hypothetical protein